MVGMAAFFCAMNGYAWFILPPQSSIKLDVRSVPWFLKYRTEISSPNPIGQVPARPGPNSKETKNYSSYSHCSIQLSVNSSPPHVQKAGLAKRDKPKWQTVTNKTQKMHKQTKQQNPTCKPTLNNEPIFLSNLFWCPTFGWISWCFPLFRVNFIVLFADDLHVFPLFRAWTSPA